MSQARVLIDSGNVEARTPRDIAALLRKVADRLDAQPDEPGYLSGNVLDVNGNTVGSYYFDGEETE